MLSVDQALKTILEHTHFLEEEELPLYDSLGQIASENLKAAINVPDFESAGMDGYAVRSADIMGATQDAPRILKVIGTVTAGEIAKTIVQPGAAVRIMTGAPLPSGTDRVVRFEDTDEETRVLTNSNKNPDTVRIQSDLYSARNIRKAGEELKKGELIIRKGLPIGPGDIGLAASVGLTRLKVIRRPVVAIISTGDELVNPGKPLSRPKIYNSNCLSIAAQVKRCGGIPRILGIARDTQSSLISKFNRSMPADAVITCGGSFSGDHDLVKEVVSKMGKVIFWKVNMTPGKAFSFCLIDDTREQGRNRLLPLFSLSGNPSAGMISFEVLVRPALLKMQGRTEIHGPTIEATFEGSFENKKQSGCFIWSQITKHDDSYFANINRSPEKGIFSSIAAANGLVIIPEDKPAVRRGEKVQVILLDWWENPAKF